MSRDEAPPQPEEPVDAFLDDLEDDEDWDEPPRRRGTTMRHPLLLFLVVAGAIFMFVKTWPKVDYIIRAQTPADCGDLSARPELRAKDPAALPPLPHDTHCRLKAHVQGLSILATSMSDDEVRTGDPYKDNAGRKYYLKLDGDKVFGVIAADTRAVIDFRLKRGNLLGYVIDGAGRMIDPDQEPELRATAKTLRLKFNVPDSEPIRIFDTTQQPWDRWPYVVICALMAFTALLGLFGLFRVLRARRDED